MKNLPPKFSKSPPRLSLSLVAASLVIGSLTMIQPAQAADAWESFRRLVNDAYARSFRASQQRGPVTTQIDRAYQAVRSACPGQPARTQLQSTLPNGRLVEVGNDETELTDPLAIELFKIAPGMTGKAVLHRVGYPTSSSQKKMSDYYDTADGRIAVKYKRKNNVSRVVSVGFVR